MVVINVITVNSGEPLQKPHVPPGTLGPKQNKVIKIKFTFF